MPAIAPPAAMPSMRRRFSRAWRNEGCPVSLPTIVTSGEVGTTRTTVARAGGLIGLHSRRLVCPADPFLELHCARGEALDELLGGDGEDEQQGQARHHVAGHNQAPLGAEVAGKRLQDQGERVLALLGNDDEWPDEVVPDADQLDDRQ